MERDEILREILSDPQIIEEYDLSQSDIADLKANPPYKHKIADVLGTIINENDNHSSATVIYKKIKNIHNI